LGPVESQADEIGDAPAIGGRHLLDQSSGSDELEPVGEIVSASDALLDQQDGQAGLCNFPRWT